MCGRYGLQKQSWNAMPLFVKPLVCSLQALQNCNLDWHKLLLIVVINPVESETFKSTYLMERDEEHVKVCLLMDKRTVIYL